MSRFASPALTILGFALMIAAMAACLVDDDCPVETGAGLEAPDHPGYRNPETGLCEGGGTPGGSGGECGDFGGDRDPIEPPDMALCFAGCEGLDESTCAGTDGCRAIYLSDCPPLADCTDITYTFADCWGVAPSGPDPSLECAGLDPYSCSRAEHCSARHAQSDAGTLGLFESCVDEITGDPEGSCFGEPACDAPTPECPEGTVAGRDADCWTGYCIPLDAC